MAIFSEIKSRILTNFEQNVQKVEELRKFDEILLEHITGLIKSYRDAATYPATIAKLDKLFTSVSAIKSNGSLKENYRTINNQCVVLLVSYFGSTVSEIFRKSFALSLEKNKSNTFGDAELKLTVDEIKNIISIEENSSLGDIYVKQKNINFQDMKSTVNVFKNCFKSEMSRDEIVNNIIVGQACRNGIVHSGGLVDDRLISQIRDANPRGLRIELELGSLITFEKEDIDLIIKSMKQFLEILMTKIGIYFSSE